ncbi:MAG TPA: hypothetical protein PKK26_11995 [Candidatus Wallbacteria bacterium]|nr:hypothetical protein [Candidatus Wallbacteria bacterium]
MSIRKAIIFSLLLLFSSFTPVAAESAAPPAAGSQRDYNVEAIELYQRGEIEKSFDLMHRAIESDPQNTEYRYNLALMLYKTGKRYVDAKKECEGVLELKPDHVNAKVLLKGCLDKIVQAEGVKNDTSLATSKYLETEKQVHAKNSDIPDEIKNFLKMLYLQKNFEEAYVYFTDGCKKSIPKSEYINYATAALDEAVTGVSRDVNIDAIKMRDKEFFGVVQFDVIYEKELKQPLKSAMGDYDKVLEKKRNFMFFVKENEKWCVIPPDFMVDRFGYFCSKFPEVLSYVGVETKLDREWRDSNLLELEKMGEFLENKKPEEAVKSRIMYSSLAFLKSAKDKNYSQMYDLMATCQKAIVGNRMVFIKNRMREDLRTVVRDIKLHDVVVQSRIACVKYSVEMFNNVGSENITANKLTSYLMVVKDGIDWKCSDMWRGKWFFEKYPSIYKEFNPGEDQYLEFNGRGWVDRSLEYNALKREQLTEIDNKL